MCAILTNRKYHLIEHHTMAERESIPDPRSEMNKSRDLIARGDYTPTPVGKATFFALRVLEPVLQYQILANGLGTGLLHSVGLRTLPAGLPTQTGTPIDALGLSPYRLVLLSMSVGSALKQNIWVTFLSGEPMKVKDATIIGVFNCVWNSIASYAFLVRATSASLESTFPQPALLVGSALYVTGILTELISEIQRKQFKADPKNKGKPFTGGLWSFARHINYGGYTLWRAGYVLTGGGWIMGALAGAFFFTDFAMRAVPALGEYCEKRYGEDWDKFKKQTKYKLIPGIY
jgi:protein-S-isoprenylcysteine O-methyltransferase Ste14